MTEELACMKRYIESTGRANVLLERNDFLLVEWNNAPDTPKRYHSFTVSLRELGHGQLRAVEL